MDFRELTLRDLINSEVGEVRDLGAAIYLVVKDTQTPLRDLLEHENADVRLYANFILVKLRVVAHNKKYPTKSSLLQIPCC